VARQGRKFIVMTDFNEDIQLAWIKNFFHHFDMQEALTMLMGVPSTAMHNCSSKPIDGIFVSQKLLPLITGGYLAFRAGIPRNHRLLQLDILATGLGLDLVKNPTKCAAWWLQCSNPRVANKYLGDLHSQSHAQNWLPWLRNLSNTINGNRLCCVQIQEYEQLDHEITAGKLQAECHCWKLKMNQVPWSPALSKAIY